MDAYLALLRRVMQEGDLRDDRTGTGIKSVFSHEMRFDLQEGFPLVTTKKIHWRSVVVELLWFLRGDTNVRFLQDHGVRIWNEWADANGDLGRVYGVQWRSWTGPDGQVIDQIANVIESIKHNPNSRRHIVSAWNVGELDQMALPPCHLLFQFYVANGRLSCKLIQRSADCFLGVPFNIASYSLLTHMMAQQSGLDVGEFIWSGGDCHIYSNHFDQVREQLSRTPRALPTLKLLRQPPSINDYAFEDFELLAYDPHPHIAGKVAV